LVVALVMSEAIHRFVEKPCARVRRSLAHASWLTSAASAVRSREAASALAAPDADAPKAGLGYR
jgi:peptidoglycan/LPS O-acetylase OafA/YrhL